MKKLIKSIGYHLLKNVGARFGYDLVKTSPDLSLYDDIPREVLEKRRFYNIGAGDFAHPYWTNVDYATPYYSPIQRQDFINYNLMELQPFPIENGLAEIVYCSHTIEHVTDEAVMNMLRESYRILKTGGGLRLTAPDMELDYEAYKRNDLKFWYWRAWSNSPGSWEKWYKAPLSQASIQQQFLLRFASQLSEIDLDATPKKKYSDREIIEVFSTRSMEEGLDYFTQQCRFNPDRPSNHINWWTEEKTFSFLQRAGFSNFYRSRAGQSRFAPLRDTQHFDSTDPKVSLFVEAIK